jgi:putative ABC transport system permease protein
VTALRFVFAMAWREARAALSRLALLVAAIAVGVGALVATNGFTDNLLASVRGQARALLGADLALSTGAPFTPRSEALLQDLRRAASPSPAPVARVTSFAAMAYAPSGGQARMVQVAAVEPGYPFYGRIETEPPSAWARLEEGGILADPSLLSALGVEVGDTLGLGEARFTLQGVVTNVPGDVSVRAAFGPRAFISAARLEETRLLTFGSRARYEAFLKLEGERGADRLADRFRAVFSAERVTLRTVEDDQARLTDNLGRLGRYLGLVALVALLLGGLGVASAVHVFVKRKMEAIAVLRCLGASGRRVMAVYLVEAAALGFAGSLLGCLLGVAVQLVLPRVLGDLLPVDVVVSPSPRAIALGVVLGLWATLAFALLPLLGVRRISPLAALRRAYEPEAPRKRRDPWRIAAAFLLALSVVALAVLQAQALGPGLSFAAGIGVALLVLWLSALALVRGLRRYFPRGLPYLRRQGLANLYRPANQTVAVVLALGFGAFLLGNVLLMQQNLLRELRMGGGPERANLAFFDIQPDQRDQVVAALRAAGAAPRPPVPVVPMRIESVKGLRASASLLAPGDERAVRDRWALRREYRSTYRDETTASEEVVAGAFWKKGVRVAEGEPVPVSLDLGVARELRVEVGDLIVWDVQGLLVPSRVASLREVNWQRFEPNFFAVFPKGPLQDAPQTFVVLSHLKDAAGRGRVQRDLALSLPNVTSLDLSRLQEALENLVDRITLAVRFMALFSVGAGAVVLLGAVAASRYQRVREGVLLRTLGATRAQVREVLITEYAALGLLAALLALSLAALAGWALVRFVFEARFAAPVLPLLGLGLAVVALTLIVGLWGSTDVYRRTPAEVLRAE